MTSSTAVRLRGLRDDDKVDEGEHGEEVTGVISQREKSGSVVGDEVEMGRSEESVYRVQDYVANLEQGAKPVYHRRGRSDIITLDNDTRFDKVYSSTQFSDELMKEHINYINIGLAK